MSDNQSTSKKPSPASLWAALLTVYIIWGSTYLGMRFAIETIPPFIMAGFRFLVAGVILYAVMRLRGAARPQPVHWRSTLIIGMLLVGGGPGVGRLVGAVHPVRAGGIGDCHRADVDRAPRLAVLRAQESGLAGDRRAADRLYRADPADRSVQLFRRGTGSDD